MKSWNVFQKDPSAEHAALASGAAQLVHSESTPATEAIVSAMRTDLTRDEDRTFVSLPADNAATIVPDMPAGADDDMSDLDLPTAEVLRSAVLAGVEPERVLGPWLEYCLSEKDIAGTRDAIEACAPGLDLGTLPAAWTFSDVISRSDRLRKLLHISIFNLLDEALIAAGEIDEADAIMRLAIATYPQYSAPALRLAQRHYDRKQREQGDAIMSALLLKMPADAQSILLYGRQTASLGATSEASALFESAVKGGVSGAQVISQWIEGCLKSNNVAEARTAVEVCAKDIGLEALQPNWTWSEAFSRSEKLRSLHLSIYNMLDDALIASGQTEEADALMREAAAAYPQFTGPALRLAHRLYDRGQRADGDAVMAKLLQSSPTDTQSLVLFGRQAAAHGATAQASDVFTGAIKGGAAAEQIVLQWVEACLKVGDLAGARQAVETCANGIGLGQLETGWTWASAVAKSDKLKGLHISSFNLLDDALMAAGQPADADALMQQVIALHPKFSAPVLRLAQRHYERKQWADGDKLLVAFMSRVPEDAHAASVLARRTAASGSVEDTVMIVETAIRAGAPADNLIGVWLEACLKSNDMAGARRAVEVAAESLGLGALPQNWTWGHAIGSSRTLSKAVHLSLIYMIEDQLVAAKDAADAIAVLRAGVKNFPQYSGPVIRLAGRLADAGQVDEAVRLLAGFLKQVPGDLQAATLYARLIAKRRMKR